MIEFVKSYFKFFSKIGARSHFCVRIAVLIQTDRFCSTWLPHQFINQFGFAFYSHATKCLSPCECAGGDWFFCGKMGRGEKLGVSGWLKMKTPFLFLKTVFVKPKIKPNFPIFQSMFWRGLWHCFADVPNVHRYARLQCTTRHKVGTRLAIQSLNTKPNA